MANGHLSHGTSGHLLRNAAGHLVNACAPVNCCQFATSVCCTFTGDQVRLDAGELYLKVTYEYNETWEGGTYHSDRTQEYFANLSAPITVSGTCYGASFSLGELNTFYQVHGNDNGSSYSDSYDMNTCNWMIHLAYLADPGFGNSATADNWPCYNCYTPRVSVLNGYPFVEVGLLEPYMLGARRYIWSRRRGSQCRLFPGGMQTDDISNIMINPSGAGNNGQHTGASNIPDIYYVNAGKCCHDGPNCVNGTPYDDGSCLESP